MMRVLVVEDEEMIRKGIVLATDWQSLGCVVVGEAANGEEGIAQAEKCRPSLIITDLKMPKMDGLEMIAKLREAGCDAYIIILTAYDSFTYAQTALRLGAVDFLLKPFHDGDLENAVLALQKKLSSRKKEPEAQLPAIRAGAKSRYVQEAMDYIAGNCADPRPVRRAGGGKPWPERGTPEPPVQEGDRLYSGELSHALPDAEGHGASQEGKAPRLRGRRSRGL